MLCVAALTFDLSVSPTSPVVKTLNENTVFTCYVTGAQGSVSLAWFKTANGDDVTRIGEIDTDTRYHWTLTVCVLYAWWGSGGIFSTSLRLAAASLYGCRHLLCLQVHIFHSFF